MILNKAPTSFSTLERDSGLANSLYMTMTSNIQFHNISNNGGKILKFNNIYDLENNGARIASTTVENSKTFPKLSPNPTPSNSNNDLSSISLNNINSNSDSEHEYKDNTEDKKFLLKEQEEKHSNDVKVLGFVNLSGYSSTMQFIICCLAVFGFFIPYGYIQVFRFYYKLLRN